MSAMTALANAEMQRNPYPHYQRLVTEQPVLWDEWHWVISSHAEVLAVLSDPGVSSKRALLEYLPPEERAEFRALVELNTAMMLFLDPPSHTRLRGLVAKAFSAKMIEQLRPRIAALVNEMLDEVDGAGEWDVMTALANPLPAQVIAELLGVPPEDRDQFRAWTNDYATWLGTLSEDVGLRQRANLAAIEMGRYLQEIFALRRRRPADDLITALVQAEEEGDRLSEQELLSTVFLLLAAGNETTTNLIGNGLLTLLRNPDQLTRVRAEPELIRPACEELLRYESPVQFTARLVSAPIQLDEALLEPGTFVTLLLAAANRDPRQFDQPQGLDIGRRPNRHLSLAHGPHFCLGAPLARAEGQIAIGALVQRFPQLELASDSADWRFNPGFRGLRSLPVRS